MLRWIGNCLLFAGGVAGGLTGAKPTNVDGTLIAVCIIAGVLIHLYDEIENG